MSTYSTSRPLTLDAGRRATRALIDTLAEARHESQMDHADSVAWTDAERRELRHAWHAASIRETAIEQMLEAS